MWSVLLGSALAVTISPLPSLAGHPKSSSPQVRFDPTGTRMVSWADDGVRIWSAEEGTALRFVAGKASTVSVDNQGRTIVIGYEGHAERVDVETGAVMYRWTAGWDWVADLALDPRGRWLVVSDGSEGAARKLNRYDLETGAELEVPDDVRTGTPRGFSPSGVLHFTDSDGHLHSWDPSTGETWTDARPGLVARVDWSVGGGWMAVAAWDWPVSRSRTRGTQAQSQPWRQGWVRVRGPSGEDREIGQTGFDLAISPRGRWVALARDNEIRLVDGSTGDVVGTLDAGGAVSSVDWGAQDMLVAGVSGGLLKRWRVAP